MEIASILHESADSNEATSETIAAVKSAVDMRPGPANN